MKRFTLFLVLEASMVWASAQTIHRISGIHSDADGTISLRLDGSVSQLFSNYFDLYPLETTTNLRDWTPLVPLLRTNAMTGIWEYREIERSGDPARFYRLPTNHLITSFTIPTGPYRVGMVSRLMTDPSRTNRYEIPTNSSFMISIWYPAVPRAGLIPGRWLDTAVANHVSWQAYAERVRDLVGHSLPGAVVATNEAPYPIILYSIGLGGIRVESQDLAEELASHGYIVVGIDHVDCMISVFPNGTVVYSGKFISFEEWGRQRIADARFVLDRLAVMNESDPLFAGTMDVHRVGIYGHSNGGVTAGEVCQQDQRVRAAVVLDGYVSFSTSETNLLRRFGLQKPFLAMFNSVGSGDPLLLNSSVTNGYSCQINPSVHETFVSSISVSQPTPSSREAARTIRVLTHSFFDKFLKDHDDQVLTAPTSRFPMVTNFQTTD